MCRCLFLPSLLFRGGEKGEGVIAFCIQVGVCVGNGVILWSLVRKAWDMIVMSVHVSDL